MGEQCDGCERDLRDDEGNETEDMVMLCDDCWQECVDDPSCHNDGCPCDKCSSIMKPRERLEAFLWGLMHPFATDGQHREAAIARVRKYHPELYELGLRAGRQG